MNNLIVFVVLNSFLVLNVSSASVKKSTTIFDDVKNDEHTCPLLSKNILMRKHLENLTLCTNFPADGLNDDNREKYLCVGVLHSYLNLCTRLSRIKETEKLQLNFDLEHSDCSNLTTACNSLKQYNSADTIENDSKKVMSELDQRFKNPAQCLNLCISVKSDMDYSCSVICAIRENIKLTETIQTKSAANQEKPTIMGEISSVDSKHPIKPIIENQNKSEIDIKDQQLIPTDNQEPLSAQKLIAKNKPENDESVAKMGNTSTINLNIKNQNKTQLNPGSTSVAVDKSVQVTESQKKDNKVITDSRVTEGKKDNNQSKNNNPVDESAKSTTTKATVPNSKESINSKKSETIFDDNDTIDVSQEHVNYENDDNELFNKNDVVGEEPDKIQIQPPASSIDKQMPDTFDETEESNFFSYFMLISVVFIFGYIIYHNKQKILALVLEGRKDRNSRRRPNTAGYRKLNSNLEEAVTSKSSGSAAHVIY